MDHGFELKAVEGKGEGIFATRSFKPGEIVMIGKIEKVLNSNHSHAAQIAKNKYILYAGFISKVNHSCDPNCGKQLNADGVHDFVAIKEISVGEEITHDYAMANYTINFFPAMCMCGSNNCRGKITGWKDLPEKIKSEYKGYVLPYLYELDAEAISTT